MDPSGRDPSKQPSKTSQQLLDDTTRHLARVLRHAVERGAPAAKLVELSLVQLCRPERPGSRLSAPGRARLREALEVLVLHVEDPIRWIAIERYARAASEVVITLVPRARHPGAALATRLDSSRKLAEAAVWAERGLAHDDEDLVRRAVTRGLRERRRGFRGKTTLAVGAGDPLRGLLDLPSEGSVVLARHDLRTHLLRTSVRAQRNKDPTQMGLVPLLRRVARFSEAVLRPGIGDDLWALCRPVGFADKAETRVLVEVLGSVFAQEVALRKNELLHRLRLVDGFALVKDVRFAIDEDARPRRRTPQPVARPATSDRDAEALSGVRDDALRRVLERMIKS